MNAWGPARQGLARQAQHHRVKEARDAMSIISTSQNQQQGPSSSVNVCDAADAGTRLAIIEPRRSLLAVVNGRFI